MMHAAVYAIRRPRSHPRQKGPASIRPFSFPHGPNTSCAVPCVSQTIGRRLNTISPVYSARVETGRDEPVAVAAMPSGVPVNALQREARVRRGSPRRTRRLRWDQTRTCQVVMTGQVKSDQVRSGQVSNSSQGSSGQLLPIALLDIVIGIGIHIGLRQRVYSTTDGKRRRGHFDTCAF